MRGRLIGAFQIGAFLVGSLLLCAAPVSANESAPWRHSEPFALSAEELRAATDLPADHPLRDRSGVVVLFQDTSYSFDTAGRLTQHRHWIYRIFEADAIADWSTSQVRWAPWRQHRPKIRARILSPDGQEHWLDPDTSRDRQAPETADRRAGERLLTEAPLPAVSVGAVIEEHIVLTEHTPEWNAGTAHRHYTALLAPTLDGRVTLDSTTRLALRFGARLMPGLEPTSTTVEDGRVRVVFDFENLPAVIPPQDGAPGHRPRFPQIAFSTGRSWQSVATAFSQQVDHAIATAGLLAIGEDLRGSSGLTAEPRITAILEAVRSRVGFNGFEIGAMALDFDVDRTLDRGEGDSLTLAIVAVAALRRAGLEAQVALVKTGFGVDVEPRLPGVGLFNHALVHLGAPDEPGQWLEPSARYVRAGELSLAMQGRFALIASPQTEALERTPTSEPADNLAIEVREIFFSDFGPGRLVERCQYFGSAERTQRRITGSLDADSRRRGYEAYVNAFHVASQLGFLRETEPLDLSGPFELELEALDSSRVRTDVESAVLEVPIRELARRLPPVLIDDQRPRSEEYVFPEPFVSEWRYEVHPPIGFRLTRLPPSERVQLGPASFEQKWKIEGGLIIGELRFDVGQRLLAPPQFESLRSALGPFLNQPPAVIHFALESSGREAGFPALLSQLRQASEKEPDRASHRVRWALGLLQAGLGVEARLQAQKAVELQPQWGLAHWAFGWTLMHDEAGAPFGGGAQVDAARRAFTEAIRLMPDEPRVLAALARLDERNADGARYEPDADLDRAAVAYEKATRELKDPRLHRDRLRLLLAAGRFEEMASALATARRALETELTPDGLLGDVLGESDDSFDAAALAAFEIAAQKALGRPAGGHAAAVKRAAVELAAARHYQEASSLAADVDSILAERFSKARRFEDVELHPQDPETPIRSLLKVLRFDRPRPEGIAQWLRPGFGPAEVEALFFELRQLVPTELEGVPLSPPARADLALADLRVTTNGAPHLGYRLTLKSADEPSRFYITLRGDDLRLGAFSAKRSTLGAEAMKRLADGDLPGAQQWLDWARAERDRKHQVGDQAGDPLAFSPFDRLWPAAPPEDLQPADTLRAAAGALAAPFGGEPALEVLRAADERSPGDLSVQVALLDAYASAGDFLGLEAHAGAMLERYPTSGRAFVKHLEALAALEQWPRLEKVAQDRLESGAKDIDSRRVLAGLAVDRGQPRQAADLLRGAASDDTIEAADAANLLLLMLLEEPKPTAEAMALTERTRPLGERDARWWRAVAAWKAEMADISGARQALARSIEISGGRLQLPDAYVVARLAELCAMPETAEQLYKRIESEEDAGRRAPLVRLLALEHLR